MNIEEVIHRIGLLIGASVLAAGFTTVFVPGVASSFPFNLLIADIAAVFAVILGIWIARVRYRARPDWTMVPDVEFLLSTPSPGAEIDDKTYRLTRLGEGRLEYRDQIGERMREVAIAALMHRHKINHEQAAKRLDEGSWTDDTLAATFFTTVGKSVRPSLGARLKQRFTGGKTAYERQLETTVRAIEDASGFFEDESQTDEDRDLKPSMAPVGIESDDAGKRVTEDVRYLSLILTRHWTGVTAFGLLGLAFGILSSRPGVLLASGVAIGLAGYGRFAMPPALGNLEVERNVSDQNPEPGDEIEVSVTVENIGDSFLPDLRMIERIPPTMEVVDGSARLGTALRSGDSATFTYRLVVERGEHTWPLQAIGRNISGGIEREARIEPDTAISCVPLLETVVDMPVRLQTSVYSGEVRTETGGEGLEFFSVRDYQPGDPQSRIDWKNFARTGEFTTINFREENAARVVLLFDSREASYVSSAPGQKHALNTAVDAACDVFASLNDQGHLIGIAAFNGIPLWLGPGSGSLHIQRVRHMFAEHPALSALPPDLADKEVGRYVDPMTHIRRQLPSNTQIYLFSPLTDHYTYEVARRLDGAGHLVTVISPDSTAKRTVGQRIAHLERLIRIKQLRDYGIRVIDWNPERSLDLELEYAKRRW